jgi:acetyltransferase-like isoleucine patch superfamily enzyme
MKKMNLSIRQLIRRGVRRLKEAKFRRLGILGSRSVLNGSIEIRQEGGAVSIGRNCVIDGKLVTERSVSKLVIGDRVFIGGGSIVDCSNSIIFEDCILVSYQCIFADSDNHSPRLSIRIRDLQDWQIGHHDWDTHLSSPIVVRHGAWIGARSIVLKGVEIGKGSIIGAGSVVTKSVPAWTVAAGNPARVIRSIPPDER